MSSNPPRAILPQLSLPHNSVQQPCQPPRCPSDRPSHLLLLQDHHLERGTQDVSPTASIWLGTGRRPSLATAAPLAGGWRRRRRKTFPLLLWPAPRLPPIRSDSSASLQAPVSPVPFPAALTPLAPGSRLQAPGSGPGPGLLQSETCRTGGSRREASGERVALKRAWRPPGGLVVRTTSGEGDGFVA